MTIGVGIFITAVGAIFTYAVDARLDGFDVHTGGVILMVVGLVIASVATMATLSQRRRAVVVSPVQPIVAAPNPRRLARPTQPAVERQVVVNRTVG